MKLSYNWLKDYVDFDHSPAELADLLTMTGLEVEKYESTGADTATLEGVVVGEVKSVAQHPDADRLTVCMVDIGADEPLSIVCGAPNVAAGQKVPVATVGTTLHPWGSDESFKIKKGKIRGQVSMGMICAEDELGLGPEHEGIMVLDPNSRIGAAFADVLKGEQDVVFEIGLTPNRIDGGSHFGAARDIAAVLRKKARLPKIGISKETLTEKPPIPVTIADPERCKRYTSIYIRNIKVAESPDWMQQRILAAGLRPINNIVDITNYVMLELGQPLHAFDADQLAGKQVIVRTMDTDQQFLTLDQQDIKLNAGEDLMICDADRPLCIAGIKGGLNSGVTAKTVNVFLESAYFSPSAVRKSSKRMGLSTDSAFRFERGTDPFMTPIAALRAADLMREIAGGTPVAFADEQTDDFPFHEIRLSVSRTSTLCGLDFSAAQIREILEGLEMHVSATDDPDMLKVEVPPYRVDVKRPQDVMEDILRIYGYDKVELPGQEHLSLSFKPERDVYALRERLSDMLSANGFYEIMTSSLVSEEQAVKNPVKMLNPLSEEQAILRQSMLYGGLDAIVYNQNRQNEDLALYEFGKTYWTAGADYREKEWLALFLSGGKHPMHWEGKEPPFTHHSMTAMVEQIESWFAFSGIRRECQDPEFDYALELIWNGRQILKYGRANSSIVQTKGIRNDVFFLLADWETLVEAYYVSKPEFMEVPVFPAIRRDVSMLLPETATFDSIRELVMKSNPKLIRSVDLYDVYRDEKIGEGRKSYLISVLMRDERKTLEDQTADKVMARIHHLLESQIGAAIRK
jgi:phenylalanyl-tRNA synthetase beta chain